MSFDEYLIKGFSLAATLIAETKISLNIYCMHFEYEYTSNRYLFKTRAIDLTYVKI